MPTFIFACLYKNPWNHVHTYITLPFSKEREDTLHPRFFPRYKLSQKSMRDCNKKRFECSIIELKLLIMVVTACLLFVFVLVSMVSEYTATNRAVARANNGPLLSGFNGYTRHIIV